MSNDEKLKESSHTIVTYFRLKLLMHMNSWKRGNKNNQFWKS